MGGPAKKRVGRRACIAIVNERCGNPNEVGTWYCEGHRGYASDLAANLCHHKETIGSYPGERTVWCELRNGHADDHEGRVWWETPSWEVSGATPDPSAPPPESAP